MAQEKYEVRIDSLVYGGVGKGRLPDGQVVFVSFTLPGEIVVVEVAEKKPHFMRANLIEIIQPSSLRISPRCFHYGVCGGCQYQHIPYQDQLALKSTIFEEQLQRLGKIDPVPSISVVVSEDEWCYRNSLEFHLNSKGRLCFSQARSHAIFEVQQCHLPEDYLNEIWPKMDFASNPDFDRIELLVEDEDSALLMINSTNPVPPYFETDLPISAVHISPSGTIVLTGENFLHRKVLEKNFRVSAGSFFQVNRYITEKMIKILLDVLEIQPKMNVMDVYCGVGLFSSFIAPICNQLVGIESSFIASKDYAYNLDSYDNVELFQGKAEAILPYLDFHPDVVILDPPRAGIAPKALSGLVKLNPHKIIYISCNPATLATNAASLCQSGYQYQTAYLLDMFPQTYHIESINIFLK
jgi:23S rRNA (uracil1939-C5)-methyltransferase